MGNVRTRHIIAIERTMPDLKRETIEAMDDATLAQMADGCIGVAPRRSGNAHPDRRRTGQRGSVLPHGATVTAPRNAKCPCGSGKKTKKCHPVPIRS